MLEGTSSDGGILCGESPTLANHRFELESLYQKVKAAVSRLFQVKNDVL